MEKIFLVAVAMLLVSCKKDNAAEVTNQSDTVGISEAGAGSDTLMSQKELNSVKDIKVEYEDINRLLQEKKLDSVTFSYDCDGERQGDVVYYYENRQLRSIRHSYSEYSHFSAVENYFIKDGGLFFVFKKETSWNFDGGSPENPETKDDIKEYRYYMVNEKPIQCLEKKYVLHSESSGNPAPESIKNSEIKNCSLVEVHKRYQLLVRNQKSKKCIS
ncbi:MAG: hypothetical protein K0M56_02200 [Kaistella sp.]|nr:hypothetical protein [Kaistella sp.]